ncbi:MAG TPA: DoxX family protein [Membranihabitans sp.]|nr:DoxX family protein [Membranihabitans sp.]
MSSKDLGLFLIRVVFGVSMLLGHGLAKWGKLWTGQHSQFETPFGLEPALTLGIAVLAEVGGSILVILGLLTRLALIPLIITMSVALFVVHDGDAFTTMEKALLYGATFLGLWFTGPGKLSLDYLFHRTQI